MASSTTGGEDRALRAFARIKAVRDAERRSFEPSRMIERLILQVLGGWSNFTSAVNFARYSAAGQERQSVPEAKIAKALRELAEDSGVRWPHQEFSSAVDHAGTIRHSLAHMLYITEIDDEAPDRVLRFVRLGEPGKPRTTKGVPSELRWRDEIWSSQSIHQAEFSEQELRRALAELKWMWESVRALSRLGGMLADHPELPDDHEITLYPSGPWWIPWAPEDWFNGNHAPTIGDVRLPKPPSTA